MTTFRPEEDFTQPFRDPQVRAHWLNVVEFLEDDELVTLTYRDWIQVAKDEAFEGFAEDVGTNPASARSYLQCLNTVDRTLEFIEHVQQLQAELMYLNRRNNARTNQDHPNS